MNLRCIAGAIERIALMSIWSYIVMFYSLIFSPLHAMKVAAKVFGVISLVSK